MSSSIVCFASIKPFMAIHTATQGKGMFAILHMDARLDQLALATYAAFPMDRAVGRQANHLTKAISRLKIGGDQHIPPSKATAGLRTRWDRLVKALV